MPAFSQFVRHLKDRKLAQWGVAYLATAWVGLQVLGQISGPWGISEGVQRSVQVLAVAGFLLTLVLAWYHGKPGQQRSTVPEVAMIVGLVLLTVWTLGTLSSDSLSIDPAPIVLDDLPRPGSIAVLPFENLSTEPNDELFTDGFHEELITRLSRVSQLKVISRTSVMEYRGRVHNVREIGRRLGVENIVEGSVRWAGEEVRIVVTLVEVATDNNIWSETFDAHVTLDDLLGVQATVAARIVADVRGRLSPEEASRLQLRPTESFDAFRSYQIGRSHLNKRTREGLSQATIYFTKALEQDSSYALAHVGLADIPILLVYYGWLPPVDALTVVRFHAEQALRFDSALGEAHTSIAEVLWFLDRNWLGAEDEFERAIASTPGYAQGHHWYAYYLAALGRHEQALARIDAALALDPLSLIANTWKGVIHRHAGRADDAIEQFLLTLELDNDFALAHGYLGLTYSTQGEHEAAITHLEQAVELDPEGTRILSMLGYAYGVAGRRDDALDVIRQLRTLREQRYVPSYDLGFVYVGLADQDAALRLLEQAAEEKDPMHLFVNNEPAFDGWRENGRFQDLVRLLDLPRTE